MMPAGMWRRNLTGKILLAVGITVAVVIAIYTYFVIRVQSAWWHERTHAQNAIAATLVHEYLEGVMLSERHEEVSRFLGEMKRAGEVTHGHVVGLTGKVFFSTETQNVGSASITLPVRLFSGENRVLQGARAEGRERLAIAMTPVRNRSSCQKCHKEGGDFLGAIVVEKSFAPAEKAIADNRNLMLLYGVLIFLLVGVVLWLLIVRLVTQPVSSVLEQMRRVEEGDLQARAEIGSDDQIGQLATGFNAMVGSLETARRELHESHGKQIQQASKLASIGELAAGIAHEIRNPLAGIRAAVEVLHEDGQTKPEHGEIVTEIHRQITRLNNTLSQLLDFSRQRDPEIVPLEVCDVIHPMVALVKPDAQKQHVQLDLHCPEKMPLICADAQQLQQAILNILLNAIQAMPDGGTLTVRGDVLNKTLLPGHDRTVQVVITDTGTGIAKENLAKMFSPFFTTKHRGTGLGLAITRSIIEKHHGRITVESEVGHGTTVVLEFVACKPGAKTTDGPCALVQLPEK
jgi:signal transduction histidine kinase